jgi:C4-dicarboxylate-specific signal transduction histidine kinase
MRLRRRGEPERTRVRFAEVQDSGTGISIKDPARVFDPFFTTKPAGMELGLSICQTIVEEHGGKLRIARTDAKAVFLNPHCLLPPQPAAAHKPPLNSEFR